MGISKQQILSGDNKALQSLLSTHYIAAEAELGVTLGQLQSQSCAYLAQAIRAGEHVLIWDETGREQLKNIKYSALIEQAYTLFCFDVLLPYLRAIQLDEALLSVQHALRDEVFIQALADAEFWIKPHGLKNLVDFLYLSMLGWQPGFGQHSDNLYEVYQEVANDIKHIALADKEAFLALEKTTRSKVSALQVFLDRFTQRMKETETGKIKNRISQHHAYRFISELTRNKVLPIYVAQYIQETLLADIHLYLLRHGLDAPLWQSLQTYLPLLMQMYSNFKPQYQQLPEKLRALLLELVEDTQALNDFINGISFDVSLLAANQTIEQCQQTTELIIPEHLLIEQTQASQALLERCKQFKEGQWFVLRNENNTLERCKLTANLEEYQQVLFSNFVGQRSLVTSMDDFAYLLSAKHLQALSMYGGLTRCLHSKLDTFLETFNEKHQHRNQQLETLRQQRLQMAQEQARKVAAAKAQAEAEAIAERKQQARLAEEKAQLSADLKRHARLSLDSLSLGTWVEFQKEDGQYQRAKLAVKFNATGRFVFVDDSGMTLVEAQRDDLVQMLLNGQMKQLESDKKFAERLAKIVSDIRISQ